MQYFTSTLKMTYGRNELQIEILKLLCSYDGVLIEENQYKEFMYMIDQSLKSLHESFSECEPIKTDWKRHDDFIALESQDLRVVFYLLRVKRLWSKEIPF